MVAELVQPWVPAGSRGAQGPSPAGADLAVLLMRFGRDVILLLKDLARDSRVPLGGKLAAGAAAAYLVSPLDVVPDYVPRIGQLDDLGILVLALRKLLASAGHDLIRQRWRGSDDGLALVLSLAGVEQ